MKLYLKNHAERYPVEQLQLQLFAQEPSEFCTEPFTGDGTVSSLSRGKRYLTATAKVTYQGKTGFAVNRVRLERPMCVQRGAFYSAAIIWLLCRCFRPHRLGVRSPACGRQSCPQSV